MVITSARIFRKKIEFLKPALTSRNTFTSRNIFIVQFESAETTSYGECAPLSFLSIDDLPDYQERLIEVVEQFVQNSDLGHIPHEYPSMRFGIETAFFGLKNERIGEVFEQQFTKGVPIPINGLVWMGPIEQMLEEADRKVQEGFKAIKFKIGAHDFERECSMLESFRAKYSSEQIEIRLDANGAFNLENGISKLQQLSSFSIHSVEQPIPAGSWKDMGKIVSNSEIPIALDEELIGVDPFQKGAELIEVCNPSYLILKPNLLGGFSVCDKWVDLAATHGISWWATSALESNIGLNAIAQWTATKDTDMAQGLGTGSLYTNNISSPLKIRPDRLCYESLDWKYDDFLETADQIFEIEK